MYQYHKLYCKYLSYYLQYISTSIILSYMVKCSFNTKYQFLWTLDSLQVPVESTPGTKAISCRTPQGLGDALKDLLKDLWKLH